MNQQQFLAHHNGSSSENSQDILYTEMVLGSAVWDWDIPEYHNPHAWCGTPSIMEWEKRTTDLFTGMFKDLDDKALEIKRIKEEMKALAKEDYDLGFGGDGFDRLDPIF